MWNENKSVIVLALIVAMGYGAHMLHRYVKVRADLNTRSAKVVHPSLSEDNIAEVGYVYSMRDELFLRDDNTINLVWFIKVPATGERYSCVYESGFSDFRQGDDVTIIRPKNVSDDAGYGYLVGLHEKVTRKTAMVWVIDEENQISAPDEEPVGP